MSKQYTKSDIGLVPFSEPNRDEYLYYKGLVAYVESNHDFVCDQDNDDYPNYIAENPIVKFDNDDYAFSDFVYAWDYLNSLTDDDVIFDFNVNGELELQEFIKEE